MARGGAPAAGGDTRIWKLLRNLGAYQEAFEAHAESPAYEEETAFPVRVQSAADLAARDPWQIEAWENPFARDGPTSPFLSGEPTLEGEGSSKARPFLPMLADAGARIDGLRLLDGTLIVKIEQDGRAVQILVTKEGPLLAGGGLRLYHDYGLELPIEIARLIDLWSVSGGPAPRRGRGRWARNGSF